MPGACPSLNRGVVEWEFVMGVEGGGREEGGGGER